MKARNRNKARKAVRQEEAKARQAIYLELTPELRTKRALLRLGNSVREIDRLVAMMA